ncbi:RRM domain-containing protein [Fusarium keratoplasticum]|nr:RRM domain-containing protein [Fusarium keratoplasticum]
METAAPYLPSQQDRRPNSHLAVPGSSDPNGLLSQFQGMSLGGMGMPNTHSAPIHMAPPYMLGSDGHFVLAPVQGSQTIPLGHSNENGYTNYANGAFSNPYMGMHFPLMPFTPGRANAVHTRADQSAPATPFYAGGVAHQENGPRVASLDRSAYTTPSPQQLGLMPAHAEASKSKLSPMSERALDELLEKKPSIPKAVPAVFTPAAQMKGVEQSLQNPIPGNRNVYIRGLHPTTDDELLYHYASRFGPVETSKAIIDTGTGACKGFGFAKFYNVADSEMCIRGFHRLGYEVGFARESFNSRLKAEGDDSSTNLYISNLPKSLTEVELGTIFLGFTILSSKILRDSMGNSRGVGFARFESREVCDEIIERFTGLALGEEGLLMNIRYADTPAQKELKRVTAERRQFRTNEYNIGAYGTPLVGLNTHMYSSYQSQYHRSNNSSARCGAIPSATNTSGSDGSNDTRRSASQRRSMETAASSSLDEAIATPTSSECDENVTIHADTVIANASLHSSPSVKKEIKKETKKDMKKEVK